MNHSTVDCYGDLTGGREGHTTSRLLYANKGTDTSRAGCDAEIRRRHWTVEHFQEFDDGAGEGEDTEIVW